ncbi:aspartate/glutamate racemase family protein [Polaromonas sp. JS666]|uniref:aspartate/glutamate racemase family protein n=1 Tax=Polaromonas sp. (strain JS666 / ATCC BAA-500) TaxID=296591 RepID=UPI000943EFE9|nr:aspartate/glutamate racemase family protein [Polaromonas sp. JS666]
MTLTAASPSGETGFLGVVMLDTRFPRPPGDVGHPDAFGVPVRRHVVRGAWPGTIVQTAAGLRAAGVAPAFVRAVQALEAEGARAVTTSCGFLVLLQDELQAAARVPVVTSSLLQLPGLLAHQARVGVLTISAAALGPEHLLAAGVPAGRLADVVVQGVDPAGEFATAILGNRDTLDMDKASREVVDAALALRRREPSLQAVVLECTNLPPYRQAVEAATGLKTWALTDDERLLRPWC